MHISMEQVRHLFLVPFFWICWVLLRSALLLLAGRHLTITNGSSGDGGDALMSHLLDGTIIGKSNTLILQPDLSAELPHDGLLYRLGNLHRRRINVDSNRALRIRQLHLNAQLKYDLMWNDFRGAFDQDVLGSGGANVVIPWQEPHEPLFCVVYGNATDFQVEYVEGQHLEYNSTAMEVYNFPRRDLFYQKRTGSGGRVTLCTQITPERLQYLTYIVQNWGGPVSAVVFVGYRGNQDEELSQVNKYWEIVGEGIKVYLDLHIVYDDKRPWYSTTSDPASNLGNNPYPVNLLRQICVDSAKTDWVLMSEGDMLTTPNAHAHIEESWDDMMKEYTEQGGAAFVVPIYRVRKSIDKKTFDEFPRTKQDLLKSTKPKRNILRNKNKKVDITDDYFRASKTHRNQRLCDYGGWEALASGSNTFLPYHNSGQKGIICNPPEGHTEQEPYVLLNKFDMPAYNSLFAGMWWDKTTHIIDLCNCGLTFLLHPSVYTVIFEEPKESGRSGAWGGHIPNWRQEFVFAMGPAFAQEYQKSMLANGMNRTMCSRVADIPVGQPQPYPPWVPAWMNSTRQGQLRLVGFAEHLQWVSEMQKQKAALQLEAR